MNTNDTNPDDRSFSTLRANTFAVLLVLPVIIAVGGVYVMLHGFDSLISPLVSVSLWRVGFVMLAGIVAHELLHVATWRVFGGLPRDVLSLGFSWRTLTPYAHCSVPMRATPYIVGAAVPGVVLGLVPSLIGLLTASGGWLCFGLLFTLAAGGDALIVWSLRDVGGDTLVADHPTRPGCIVLRQEGC